MTCLGVRAHSSFQQMMSNHLLAFVRSKCNDATAVSEKLEHENLDLFLQVLRTSQKIMGKDFTIWKESLFFILSLAQVSDSMYALHAG